MTSWSTPCRGSGEAINITRQPGEDSIMVSRNISAVWMLKGP
jgi:hypothetical protein